MRLSITSDYRLRSLPDGSVWTDGPCPYRHWTRYLNEFSSVNVLARVTPAEKLSSSWQPLTGPGVSVSPLPNYQGALEFLRHRSQLRAAVRQSIAPDDALILNGPSILASLVEGVIEPGRPYGMQVLGNPKDIFRPGMVKHPLRPLLGWWCTRRLTRQVQTACATLYVTQQYLQQCFPCRGKSFGVSDVDLPPEAFREEAFPARPAGEPLTLVAVGTMTQMYKGFDVLLAALAMLKSEGLRLRLRIVGDGNYRPQLEGQAQSLGLADDVTFVGQLANGAAVRAELDRADLFVMPSRTEGLPRALVEAMARRLPCVASSVGGIPELLPPEDLCRPGCARSLAQRLRAVVQNPARRERMAQRNYERSLNYRSELLTSQRNAFYGDVAAQTSRWLREAARPRKLQMSLQPERAEACR